MVNFIGWTCLRISLSICVCWLGDCDCSPVTLLDCLLHPHKPSVLRFDRFCFLIPTPASQSPLLLCPPLHFPPSPPPPPHKTAGAVVSKTPGGGHTLARPPSVLQGAALAWCVGSSEPGPCLASAFSFPLTTDTLCSSHTEPRRVPLRARRWFSLSSLGPFRWPGASLSCPYSPFSSVPALGDSCSLSKVQPTHCSLQGPSC